MTYTTESQLSHSMLFTNKFSTFPGIGKCGGNWVLQGLREVEKCLLKRIGTMGVIAYSFSEEQFSSETSTDI